MHRRATIVCALAEGTPPQAAEVAAWLARELDARIVLMIAGTTRRGTLDHIFAGSVAAELASRARCPVNAVSDGASISRDGPLVLGYDGSDHSIRATRCAAVLAAALQRQLVMVHVVDHDTEQVGVEAPLVRELRGASRDDPSAVPQRPAVAFRVVHGSPAEQLIDVASEQDAAILITGTRGRGAISSALLGSVSAAVVRAAPSPVMLLGPTVVSEPPADRRQA
jgi:nucleotide-binding universal stress UspA family protein